MYQALYRKWRPKSFADVIGQKHITDTLQRQVSEGRLSHAYLFTGTRGTGKTTCAKILSKAVNCQHPVDGNPCNACPACLGIDNGSFLDVLELDAASNNGVDHVRALRDEAIYSPANVRYRVYIVDEVHMLSTAAFNALLKILEEPPAHLIFILATTELQKVPATILSRCQRFAFKRIIPRDIADRLLYVAREENIGLTPGGADLLARLADGALRDALSLLDQCAAVGGTIDADKVLEVLGLAGNLQSAKLMEHVLCRDPQNAVLLLNQLYAGGKDVSAVLNELSTLARDLLIRMTAPEGGAALLSGGYDSSTMDYLATLCNPARLIHVATLLQSTTASLSLSANRRTDAELCLLRLCDDSLCGDLTALASRIARLEEGGIVPRTTQLKAAPTPKKEKAAPPPPAPAPEPIPAVDDIPWEIPPEPERPIPEYIPEPVPYPDPIPAPFPEPMPEPVVVPYPEPISEPAPVPKADSGNGDIWDALINAYKNQLPPMYRAFLDSARGTLSGDLLTVVCQNDFTKNQLHNVKVQSVLQEVTSEAEGRPIAVAFTVGELPAPSSAGGGGSADKLDDLISFGSQFDNFKIK